MRRHDLHDRLAALAGDMTGTDLSALRARVDRRSRRLGNRRALGAVTAVAAAVAVLIAGVVLMPRPDKATPPIPAESPSASPSVSPTVSGPPGAFHYLTLSPGEPIRLTTFSAGTSHTTTFGNATTRDVYAAPSPDGTRLVVNTTPDHDRLAPGDLVIVDPGGARRTISHDVRWDGGRTASWTPDGLGVVAAGARYDPTNGARVDLGGTREYLVFSPDGRTIAYTADTPNGVDVARLNDAGPRLVSVAGLAECEHAGCPTSVQGVSDDGRYVALGEVNSDPSHVYRTAAVLDTLAGRRVDLGHVEHVWFRTGGALVDDGTRLTLYDGEWKPLNSYPLPEPENETTRLVYAP
jgi:hypothetical protein